MNGPTVRSSELVTSKPSLRGRKLKKLAILNIASCKYFRKPRTVALVASSSKILRGRISKISTDPGHS